MQSSVFIAEGSARKTAVAELKPDLSGLNNDQIEQLVASAAHLDAMFKADPNKYDQHAMRVNLWRGLLCASLLSSGDSAVAQVASGFTITPQWDQEHLLVMDYTHQVEMILWLKGFVKVLEAQGRTLRVSYDLESFITASKVDQNLLISALVDIWWDFRASGLRGLVLLPEGCFNLVRLCDKAKIISDIYRVGVVYPSVSKRKRKS